MHASASSLLKREWRLQSCAGDTDGILRIYLPMDTIHYAQERGVIQFEF